MYLLCLWEESEQERSVLEPDVVLVRGLRDPGAPQVTQGEMVQPRISQSLLGRIKGSEPSPPACRLAATVPCLSNNSGDEWVSFMHPTLSNTYLTLSS